MYINITPTKIMTLVRAKHVHFTLLSPLYKWGSEPKSFVYDHMVNEAQGRLLNPDFICQDWGYFCYPLSILDIIHHHQNETDSMARK